jgi:hypothetical protein
MGEWRYNSTIVEIGPRRSWVVSFTPRPLSRRGRSPWYPLDRRLGGPHSTSGYYGEKNNLLLLSGIEPWPSSPYPVSIPTELSWLLSKSIRKSIYKKTYSPLLRIITFLEFVKRNFVIRIHIYHRLTVIISRLRTRTTKKKWQNFLFCCLKRNTQAFKHIKVHVDTIGFWRWCITHRDIGFSDFVHRPDFS